MENLKSARTQYRRLFMTAYNDFCNRETELSIDDKISKLKVIDDKANIMMKCENEFREILFASQEKEEDIEKEIDVSESYIDKWRVLENKLNNLINEKRDLSASSSISGAISTAPNKFLHYPKINLPTFDGNIKNWLCFWGQFQKIDKDSSLDNHDKYAYLAQAMEKGSSADEFIKSFPPGGEFYEKAVKQLQLRYGREELLIEVYVRDLLSIVLLKQKSEETSLRKLYDQLETKLRALETLGVTKDKYAAMLYPLVESALPDETLKAWGRFRTAHRRVKEESQESKVSKEVSTLSKSMPTNELDRLLGFLQDEVEGEERILMATQSFDQCNKRSNCFNKQRVYTEKKTDKKLKFGNAAQVSTAADLMTSSQSQRPCIFCSNFHRSADCIKVRKMPVQERERLVGKSRCCFLCLKWGHSVRQCHLKVGCLTCGKRHHILLCRNIQSPTSLSKEKIPVTHENSEKDSALANVSKSPSVMLQTLMVFIRGKGRRRKARAIIDSASQRSYVLSETAKEMKYKTEGVEYLQHALFGGKNTGLCKHDVFKLYLTSVNNNYNCNFNVLSQSVICEMKPPTINDFCTKELLNCNVTVDDDNEAPIEILIGADIAGKLMTGGYKLLPSGLAAIETRLGWTVMGRTSTVTSNECSTLIAMMNRDASITDLWTLDTLGIMDPSEKKTKQELQEAAKAHFLSTVKVKNDRFIVNLPWLEQHRVLPDNYELASKRLKSTLKKLEVNGLRQDYDKVFDEWLREGIIEEVPQEEVRVPCHYLPHRPVIKENSTTPIRPVFDASAREKGSPSLNECLEKGPNLIEMIPTILNKFRLEKIGVISDIRKAFLQISISPNDKNFLRFLWIDPNGDMKIYRHCRVVFGTTCSPFLLGAVIQYHLQRVLGESTYPEEVIWKLFDSFYVDNCITSVKDELELRDFIKIATRVMAERKFDLRGWEYTDLNGSFVPPTSVLGLLWNKKSDTLKVNMPSFEDLCDEKITKRAILSAAHRIFDPLGITCPVALLPKLLLQRLWKINKSWDQEVDSETETEFRKWIHGVSFLSMVEIPRWIRFKHEDNEQSLHVFCDASQSAYAACAFLRVETENSIYIQLIQAKSRVSPCGKKATGVARLELLGATIAARLSSNILKDIPVSKVYFWTDSTTVLAWLRRDVSWGVFVQNRVEEILSLTTKEDWRFVPGIFNPADLPSRGCTAQQLALSKWWEGPEWLYLPSVQWPKAEEVIREEEVNSEKLKKIVSAMLTAEISISTVLSSRTNDYKKTVHIVAWIKRFIYNCRNPRQEGPLTVTELDVSERAIIRLIQRESFNNDDKRLKTLDIFLDKGIFRLKTLVFRREDLEEFRMPAVLPGEHPIVRSLILEEHKKKGHAGVSHTLNSLREKFWILCGRRTVKSVIRSCTICKRYAAKNNKPPTIPPPSDRVQDSSVFQVTGIDFAGPVILRDKCKAWICLFTCAVYRAVHLELVTSLSTETFLLAFHRFVARRGRPLVVYTDNGSNFTGAANILSGIDFDKVCIQTREDKIVWKFIPPGAPWWGGWWERLVGMMKTILKKTLGKASLNHEEMTTALCNCEAILNDRPLTAVTSDHSISVLTPSDFLRDIRSSVVPNIKVNKNPNHLRRRLRYIQTVRTAFRARFRQEYLGSLCIKQRNHEYSPLKIGDIVLIGDEDKKRQSWPLGRITEVFPGVDGIIRRVKVKTQGGELFRAAQKIYPLETSSEENIIDDLSRNKFKTHIVKEQSREENPEDKSSDTPVKQITRCGRVIKRPVKLDL